MWLLLCLRVLVVATGQASRGNQLPPLSHQAWSTEEGLPANGVHAIFQSRDGFIWLATEGGAVRFDGNSFVTYSERTQPGFAGSDVSAIAEDGGGNMWFATSEGLSELRHGVFRKVAEQDGLPSGGVLALAAPKDGSMLVLTGRGLWRFDGEHLRALESVPAGVSDLSTLSDGTVLLLTESGVLRYEHANAVAVPMPSPENVPLLGVRKSEGGALWMWSARVVVSQREGDRREWRTGMDLPNARISALEVDRRQLTWIGTSHGLYALEPGTTDRPLPVDALQGEAIASLLSDREGNLWVGTEGSGLHVLRPRTFRSVQATSGEAVTSVVEGSDKTLWFGTRNDGVHAIRAGELITPVAATSLTSPVILSVAAGAHGDLWAGTPDGLNHITSKRIEQFTSATGLPDDFVRSVLADKNSIVWAGTRRGLARIESGSVKVLTTADGLGSDSIGPMLEVRGLVEGPRSLTGLWIGTSAGLSHISGRSVESFAVGKDAAHGIVTAIAEDGADGLWVGVHGAGISHFRNGLFTHIASASLPDEVVALSVDHRAFLWLRGLKAVYRVDQNALRACAETPGSCDVAVAVYNTVDGLPSDTLASEGSPAAWQAANGGLWFATRTGIAATDTASLTLNTTPPPVVVERFRVDDEDMPVNLDESAIGPGHNRYAFDFAALSFTAPSKNRYRYMLEGFDRGWIDAGATHTASYTNLPPKLYVFRVQAANNDGVWNRAGASFAFRVLPPFYRRWWFYLVVLAVFAGVGFGIYRVRVLRIEQRFALVLNERNRVAREVHDTLAQDFVSVSLQLNLASALLKGKKFDEVSAQLQETRKLVKEGLEEARQSIWNLRANTAADSLPARVTALAKRHSDASFRLRLKMGGAYHPVASQIENEVLRIAQESLSNVERHANASEARLELHYEQDSLRLAITDNGRGFSMKDAEGLQGHYGLRGMKERAAAINGTFTIQSEPGQGTCLTLSVALPEREGAHT